VGEHVSGGFTPLSHANRAFPCDEFLHLIAVGPVAAEFLLVEQALDPAPKAHLVRVVSLPDWPAHFRVPAAAQEEHCRTARPGGEQAERPRPARPAPLLLAFFGHLLARINDLGGWRAEGKLKGLRHWLCSSRQLLRGSQQRGDMHRHSP